ncbi:MAG: FxsA family protein [Acidimicrobiales bacterium]
MLVVLGLLFLVVPFVELALLIQVADGIGILNTLGLLVAISVVGAWLCKREGLGVLRRVQRSLERHELPHRELIDGALILFAGALLITPGFFTDVLGVLLLVPPTRAVIRMVVLRSLRNRVQIVSVAGRREARGPVVDTTWSDGL